MKHKWHKEIKAWADGAEIEVESLGEWELIENPMWDTSLEYRIKPQPKEPKYLYMYFDSYINRVAFTEEKSSITTYRYLGKIKLEVDDE